MKRKAAKQKLSILLVAAILLCLLGCSSQKSSHPDLTIDTSGRQNQFAFMAQLSDMLHLSAEGAASVMTVVDQQQAEYPYADLYQLEEVNQRLDFDASVDKHKYSALNEAEVLDAMHLATLVEANNTAYLEMGKFGYEDVDSDYLSELCIFIVQVVNAMEHRYPDIDWDRVYCNLGNLKILYKPGMLNYAQVSSELVLAISKNNTEIVLRMKGADSFSRVLTHEIMHIIQIGCVCEDIENCERRAGISVYWDDFSMNTADWTWFIEGSAERNMCSLTGGEAITYQYKMDYLSSFTLSVLLRDVVKADTMDTICFYSDPNLLFDAFGCETQEQRDEVLKLMITTNVLQMQPEEFFDAYIQAFGSDPRDGEETLDAFSYSLKPDICITLAKEFYENLTAFVLEKPLPANDLFCLLTLFEGQMNQHLRYTDQTRSQINAPFISSYTAMRQALFEALEADNLGLDIAALYADYSIIAAGDNLLNASLSRLPVEKRGFLAERAEWLSNLYSLGQKVPFAE